MRLLYVLNAGSSSLKFDLIELTAAGGTQRLRSGAFVDADGGLRLATADPHPRQLPRCARSRPPRTCF